MYKTDERIWVIDTVWLVIKGAKKRESHWPSPTCFACRTNRSSALFPSAIQRKRNIFIHTHIKHSGHICWIRFSSAEKLKSQANLSCIQVYIYKSLNLCFIVRNINGFYTALFSHFYTSIDSLHFTKEEERTWNACNNKYPRQMSRVKLKIWKIDSE